MNVSAAIADPLLLRVKRERDKQDVRDRRDSKFRVRSSENIELRTSNPRVSLISPFPPVSRAKTVFPQPASKRLILTTDMTENSQEAVVCLPQR
jgi:hypothetical protein